MYNLGVLFTQGVEGVDENHQLAFEYFSQVRHQLDSLRFFHHLKFCCRLQGSTIPRRCCKWACATSPGEASTYQSRRHSRCLSARLSWATQRRSTMRACAWARGGGSLRTCPAPPRGTSAPRSRATPWRSSDWRSATPPARCPVLPCPPPFLIPRCRDCSSQAAAAAAGHRQGLRGGGAVVRAGGGAGPRRRHIQPRRVLLPGACGASMLLPCCSRVQPPHNCPRDSRHALTLLLHSLHCSYTYTHLHSLH